MRPNKDDIYWRPKKKPKEIAAKGTLLGWRRLELVDEWALHALTEHDWANRYGDGAVAARTCWKCAEFTTKIKESETWT